MERRVKPEFKDARLISTYLDLPLIERIRLICGSRLSVDVQIDTQWKMGEVQSHSTLSIEKVFTKRTWRRVIDFFLDREPVMRFAAFLGQGYRMKQELKRRTSEI